jgi:dihydrofolate reductase
MGKLTYTAITSLDGFIEDEGGSFDWAVPDPELHAFINELERPITTYLYGRRMYETMAVWQDVAADVGPAEGAATSPEELDYAQVWRAADKVVYSRTLDAVTTPRTRLEAELDPDAVRRLKDAADGEVSISGPGLATHAFAAGLVDEVQLYVFPVVVGGGKPGLPRGVRAELALVDERRFGSGVVLLRYRPR